MRETDLFPARSSNDRSIVTYLWVRHVNSASSLLTIQLVGSCRPAGRPAEPGPGERRQVWQRPAGHSDCTIWHRRRPTETNRTPSSDVRNHSFINSNLHLLTVIDHSSSRPYIRTQMIVFFLWTQVSHVRSHYSFICLFFYCHTSIQGYFQDQCFLCFFFLFLRN